MILDVNSVMELQFLLFSCKRNRLLDFLTSIFSLFADCAAPSNKSSTSDDKGNSNQINPDELKKRTEFLKAQRDKLLAMKRAEREKQLEVRSHHIFFTNSEFSICNFVIKNNGYIGILYSYIDLWMKIHFEQIKTNDKFYEKKIKFCSFRIRENM